MDKDKLKGQITDIHTHSVGVAMGQLLSGKYPFSQDIVDLTDTLSENGVAYAVTFPMVPSVYYNARAIRYEQRFEMTGNCDFPYQLENRDLLKIIETFKLDNLIPFLSFSVRDKVSEQIADIKELSKQYRVYGLKYHALSDHLMVDDPKIYPFAELAMGMDIPIMVHSDSSLEADPMHVLKLAERYPNLRLCAAHCGHFSPDFWARINEHTNVFTDCSPLLRLMNDKKEKLGNFDLPEANPSEALCIMNTRAPGHLLWGTDTPYFRFMKDEGNLIRYSDEVTVLLNSGLKDEISVNTSRFLFGYDK